MKLVKKKVLNLLSFLKDRIGLLSLCIIVSFGWGYFVKDNTILFCLAVAFGGYILIDTIATGYNKYMVDTTKNANNKPPPKVKEIPIEKSVMKITDDDIGEIDPNYFDKFIDQSKKLPNQNGSKLVDIGNTIYTENGDIDDEEIYDNLGVKF